MAIEGQRCWSSEKESEGPQASVPPVQPSGRAWRTICVLCMVDVFTRECLVLEVDAGFASQSVARVLDEVIGLGASPMAIHGAQDVWPDVSNQRFPSSMPIVGEPRRS